MKLIGAALPRTGTMSLYAALNQLGAPCYHMKTLFENSARGRGDLEMWIEVGALPAGHARRLELLRRIFDGYDACCDAPACFVYKDLMLLYPDAKVMLTRRDAGKWRASVAEIVYGLLKLSRAPGAALFVPANRLLYRIPVVGMLGLPGAIVPMTRQWGAPLASDGELFYFDSEEEAERIEASFNQWIEEATSTIPPEKLLLLESPYRDAYEKVCGALGVPAPDQPWPHVNDKEQTRRAIPIMRAFFYAFPILTVAGLIGTIAMLLVSANPLGVLAVLGAAVAVLLGLSRLMQQLLDNASKKSKRA